ncbi:protein of unknown function [Pseudotevenvirus RB43]|uniref:Uncharacterized protein n=2 Tax=Pseudotevenvirus RB43 TaxID=115991 RepID=Q56BF5_9CAUD|nr:hypothetical protein RB43ORF244w [Escherichia phage RB43]AAX78766.1 hypothetical protein RB43ORF244w [Escherichia phage RB43]CCK74087.1 protein of unknown function [Pseudotevenvirus RB43]CCL97704.1 protein of unknown function [Pseudotevenvirus RB43]
MEILVPLLVIMFIVVWVIGPLIFIGYILSEHQKFNECLRKGIKYE